MRVRINPSKCMFKRIYAKGWHIHNMSEAKALKEVAGRGDWARSLAESFREPGRFFLSIKSPTHRLDCDGNLWEQVG